MKGFATLIGMVSVVLWAALSMDVVEAKPMGNLNAAAQMEVLDR